MVRRSRHRCRRGAVTVESAIVYSVAMLLIFGLLVGGMGMFRYQSVAHLAREGARFASTHGGKYQQDGYPQKTGVPAISNSDDLRTYLLAQANALDSSKLTVTVSWTGAGNVTPSNMPTYVDTNPNLVPPGQKVVTNNVIVTVSYQWFPEVYLVGPINLSSTSQMAMSY